LLLRVKKEEEREKKVLDGADFVQLSRSAPRENSVAREKKSELAGNFISSYNRDTISQLIKKPT